MNKRVSSKKRARNVWSVVVNLFTAVAVVACVAAMFFSREISPDGLNATGFNCFKFFTVDSNLLAAISCTVVTIFGIRKIKLPHWAFVFKFVGTVAVTITFLTVLCFLGPTMGYDKLFANEGLFLHLICPLLCILSLLFLDDSSKIKFSEALLGFLPLLVYGVVYMLAVLIFGAWTDFYGFNSGGNWIISAIIMTVAGVVICGILCWGSNCNKKHVYNDRSSIK